MSTRDDRNVKDFIVSGGEGTHPTEEHLKHLSIRNIPPSFGHLQKGFDERKEELGVQEMEDTITWRTKFSVFMKQFLTAQYVVIVLFLLAQGFRFKGFHLDNYIFYILIAGTLIQSYFLVRIIFQYLFSSRRGG